MSMLNLMSCYLAIDADLIKTALLNTVIGMGIVFLVLILISGLIYMFGYVSRLFGGKANKKADENPRIVKEVSVEEASDEELIDDTELVAVITAAIMASMGDEAPADGLVVRSIRRRTNLKKFA